MERGDLYRGGVPAGLGRLGPGHPDQGGHITLGREEAVAHPAGPAGRGRAVAADVDRHSARGRLGVGADPLERHELALEGHVVFGPHPPHHLQVLLGAGPPPGPGHAQGIELLPQPAHADPQLHPAPGHGVDGGHLLGEDEGVALGQQRDAGGQPDFGGGGGHVSQPRQRVGDGVAARPRHLPAGPVGVHRLVPLGVDDVLHRPQRLEPGRLGRGGQLHRPGPGGEGPGVGEPDAELHRTPALSDRRQSERYPNQP